MTAVEWLINEHFGGIDNCASDFRNKIYQALEMEKEQIVNAANSEKSVDINYGEQYYNENFKLEIK